MTEPRNIRNEFTLCEETGALASGGACPVHHGDACLRQYQPVTFAAPQAQVMVSHREALARAVSLIDLAVLALDGYEKPSLRVPFSSAHREAIESVRAAIAKRFQ